MATENETKKSPLDALHRELGARMVPFAGWDMPLQYEGILAEHNHCRTGAALFDVSHMGPMMVQPLSGEISDAAAALETLMPVDVAGLKEGRQRYGILTTEDGGIIDDLMFANLGMMFYLVVNAGNAPEVIEHIRQGLGGGCMTGPLRGRAMVALQGPRAEAALAPLVPEVADMRFMDVRELSIGGADCIISRSGYTGEDGFEISIPEEVADEMVRVFLGQPDVKPAGLGARDSLRLEAGLCLYGNDIDRETSPIEAGLNWAIQKVRRSGGDREGGFPGADRILNELAAGSTRKLVGLRPEGRAPVRTGATLHQSEDGEAVGTVTSGVFGPTVGAPVAMGYVPLALAEAGTRVFADVRGRRLPLTVTKMPFITTGYKR